MTNLHTIIPLEYIKQSEKLQKIECKNRFVISDWKNQKWTNYPSPSIADVIDNADELFADNQERGSGWLSVCILNMCIGDKSIEEISEFIIKNIV